MEQKTNQSTNQGHEANTMLPAVRPQMASEAVMILKQGKEIEMETGKVFDFMRYCEKAERNFSFSVQVNKYNDGYTAIQHGR